MDDWSGNTKYFAGAVALCFASSIIAGYVWVKVNFMEKKDGQQNRSR